MARAVKPLAVLALFFGSLSLSLGVAQAQDLSSIKNYLLSRATQLEQETAQVSKAADAYFDLLKAKNFDYAALWKANPNQVLKTLGAARAAWLQASPRYETIEGIVAGVEMLSKHDVLLDAGAAGKDGGDGVAPYDLTLPNGKKLEKPGNLFGVTESTLWVSEPRFTVQGSRPDYNRNAKQDYGEAGLPDANVLKAGAARLHLQAQALLADAKKWQPQASDVFGALIANVPTVSDFIEIWKNSRFVANTGASRDFGAISRLRDITDNVSSWQAMYSGVQSQVQAKDSARDARIVAGLNDLKAYIQKLYSSEQKGRRYTPQEAEQIKTEAQSRATRIANEIKQAAVQLNVQLPKGR